MPPTWTALAKHLLQTGRLTAARPAVQEGQSSFTPDPRFRRARRIRAVQGRLVRMISEMLGHSTIQLTADTYTHLMAESKRELAEKMDVIT